MKDRYFVDSNVFIRWWNELYKPKVKQFDFVWLRLASAVNEKNVIIHWEVLKEIQKQDDPLADWIKAFKSQVEPPSISEQKALCSLLQRFPNFAAEGKTVGAADPWIISAALHHSATVVTFEGMPGAGKPSGRKKPKIPFVCNEVGVPWIAPDDFLDRLLFS